MGIGECGTAVDRIGLVDSLREPVEFVSHL